MDITQLNDELNRYSPVQRSRNGGEFGSLRSAAPSGKEIDEMKKVCQDFEAICLSHLLKTMRTTSVDESGLFGKGFGGGLFQDLFDTEVARKMSVGGGIGLAQLLYQRLGKFAPSDRGRGDSIPIDMDVQTLRSEKANFRRIQNFHDHIVKASRRYDVEPALLYAVISRESSGNPNTISSKGAKGLMQLMDGTEQNISGGAYYLRQMLDRFHGDVKLALAAYNAGPGAVERYKGVPPYKETRNYVDRVIKSYSMYKEAFFHTDTTLV